MEKCAPGQEVTVLAGTEVAVEKEEYDKELEDRLYPLDEVELQERVKKIAEARKELSIEEMASYLGLPVDVLERTRGTSKEEMTSPEYWQDWFEKTLKSSTEAKRANRDFRKASTVPEPARTNSTSVIVERFGLPPEGVKKIKKNELPENEMDAKDAEAVVYLNIGVPASDGSVEDPAVRGSNDGEEPTVEYSPLVIRALGRKAVYEWLKKVRDEDDGPTETLPPRPGDEGTPRKQSIRVKVPDVDWVQLLSVTAELVKRDSVPLPDWVTFSEWVERYHSKCGELVWKKLLAHEADKASPKGEKEPRTKEPVDFDSSCLYVEVAEAVHGVGLYPEREEDISHYVEVVRPGRLAPERSEKRGLVEVVTVELPNGFGLRRDEAEETDEPEVVPGGRRVVCAVGGYEALSGGFIDRLPSRMLADTGATLSLVDRLVLKRLGRARETLRPYEGLVRSSSGHKLRIRGWITLPVRLGSLEANLNLLVAEQLNCDAILGVDALAVVEAVIDVEERTMTLKSTNEVLELGSTVVQETYLTAMAVSVRLPPRGQALVTTNVIGDVGDKATVLVEGSLGLPPTLCVARTLCTVHKGQVIVEVCNASTDEYWIPKGTVVAATSVIPESAFTPMEPPVKRPASIKSVSGDVKEGVVAETVKTMPEGRVDRPAEIVEAPKPEIPPDKGMEADFSDSALSDEQKSLFQDELNGFSDMFVESSKKPGRTELLKFEIDTGDSKPIKQQPYRVSGAEGDVMEAEVDQYSEMGFIRPSHRPWASPVLMIRKPDGGIRFCIDYRKLNAVTLFSTMAIASGYWNVPMHEDNVAKTAFTCKYGLYEWLVMPFGLCNAVPAFERLMETVLVDLKWRVCLVYLDDCVVFSDDFPSHLVRVRQVLTRFRDAGFKLKMKKCHWGRNQVAFLGHIVTPSGISPNPEKVKAVINVLQPRDVHGIRSFLGLTSYFRRYIPGYALISAPLERLKVKDEPFHWNADCESAFQQLKRALMKPPILIYPDMKKRFKLYVDSSRYAVRACLMQEADGRDRVVAYASKLLTGSQKNWITNQDGISEIECWGVPWQPYE
ncbi:hypothetical protein PF005_g15589 [Phytophthora fragariae]|uniref:Reverse transcriptase domain-containing protein n=1 Tax=Phytophthora fragariae TaxID=53985 RepID=A0A6A3X9W9_9STRA|nr:hypothetical protein PF002_g22536 [Phytophthora fragariae]KAE9199831.1 hypothetical protein PF005_g15589 [Phytophthora fragariae]